MINSRALYVPVATGVALALFFGLALWVRTVLPYDQVFVGEWIKFTGIDAYHHMRLVDIMAANFPRLTGFDPYFLYPQGLVVGNIHLMNWLIAGIAWVFGAGSPSQHLVDIVGAYFPAVLGALTVVPVYFIARELFERRLISLLAASIIALMGGEFLGRSILSFTDQHVAEFFFTTVLMMLFIMALRRARERELTLAEVKHWDWGRLKAPMLLAAFAGVVLTIYLLTWLGALLFVFILTAYLIIQFIVDHLRGYSTDYLVIIATPVFTIATVIFVPLAPSALYAVPLPIALAIPFAMHLIARYSGKLNLKRAYFPLWLAVGGLASLGIFFLVNADLARLILSQFSILNPVGDRALNTLEAPPMLFASGEFSFNTYIGNFAIVGILALVALLLLIWLAFKRADRPWVNAFIVWCIVILLAALGQRRFAYYFAVNVSILSAFLVWQFIEMARKRLKLFVSLCLIWGISLLINFLLAFGSQQPFDPFIAHIKALLWMSFAWILVETVRYFRDRYIQKDFQYDFSRPFSLLLVTIANLGRRDNATEGRTVRNLAIGIAWILVIIFVYVPAGLSSYAASQVKFAPSDGWQSALTWMRDNTPEPMGDAGAYYTYYDAPPSGETFVYPETAYSVLTWWDFGYWVTRTARRLPVTNPSQDSLRVKAAAEFFTSPDEAGAVAVMDELDVDYIVIDESTMVTKYWSVIDKAGYKESEFWGEYVLPFQGQMVGLRLFYEPYFRTMGARLYSFDGAAVTPESVYVACWEEVERENGPLVRVITVLEEFPTYEKALAFKDEQDTADCRIVSNSPFISPVPLPALEGYELVYGSPERATQTEMFDVAEVKIFRRTGG